MLETVRDDAVEIEAPNLEDAVAEALARLGARREEVEIETLREGSSGFFGLGGSPFKIRVTKRADPAAAAIQALRDILAACEIPGAVTGEWDGEYQGVRLDLEIDEEDSALLVGRRGQTLNAFQYLTAVVAGRRLGKRIRVVLDVDGFRDRRAEALEGFARRAAREARETGRPVDLDPMPPQDRRTIHVYLSGERGVESRSEGEGRGRHIVISPTGRREDRNEETDRPRDRADRGNEGRGESPGKGPGKGPGEGRGEGRGRTGGRSRSSRRGGRGRRDNDGGRRERERTDRRRAEPASQNEQRNDDPRRDDPMRDNPRRDDDFVPPTDAAIEWVKKKSDR